MRTLTTQQAEFENRVRTRAHQSGLTLAVAREQLIAEDPDAYDRLFAIDLSRRSPETPGPATLPRSAYENMSQREALECANQRIAACAQRRGILLADAKKALAQDDPDLYDRAFALPVKG